MAESTLLVSNISKIFHSKQIDTTVFVNADASFVSGSSYALMGASGTGKSTLLHMLAGFDSPDSGEIFWNSQLLQAMSDYEKLVYRQHVLGILFQEHYLIDELTVLENVAIRARIGGMSDAKAHHESHRLLAEVGLIEKEFAYPHHLSGGQQQRVALARALSTQPQWLLADEPTGNLDEVTGADILELCIRTQKQHGMGMIIATHDNAVADVMDHVLRVHNGVLEVVR